jgi:hypothetical protein
MESGQWREALAHAQNARQQFFNNPDVQALLNDILTMKAPWMTAKTEVKNQESGIRGQESGVRSQESGVRNQESGSEIR